MDTTQIRIALDRDAASFVDDYRVRTGDQRPVATGARTGSRLHIHVVPNAPPVPDSISDSRCLKPAYIAATKADWMADSCRILDDQFIEREVAPIPGQDWLARTEWIDTLGRPFTPYMLLTVCPATPDDIARTAGTASLDSTAVLIAGQQLSASSMQAAAQPPNRAAATAAPIPPMTQPSLGFK